MHSQTTLPLISSLLALTMAAPSPQAAPAPLTQIPLSPTTPSKYGVTLGTNIGNSFKIWPNPECLTAAATEICSKYISELL